MVGSANGTLATVCRTGLANNSTAASQIGSNALRPYGALLGSAIDIAKSRVDSETI